jgi:Methyltransferase domain
MNTGTTERCRCCDTISSYYETATVLGRYKVRYYCCPTCAFIQTEPPFWLEESYKSPMTSCDLGGVSRPTLNSVLTKAVINWFFDAGGRFLDFGGGYGVFTRWMRDEGYDFFHYDQHCTNLFAPGNDADVSGSVRYELVTAFEVFEHLAEPAKTVAHLLSISDSILFSTELLPIPAPPIADWWYYGPEHGQHIAFFTRVALQKLAASFSANYYATGGQVHLISRRHISEKTLQLVLHPKVRALINRVYRRKSLLDEDWANAMQQAKEAAEQLTPSPKLQDQT